MKTYTEEDLRLAFRAGANNGIDNYVSSGLSTKDEDEYIESLSTGKEIVENKVSYTYSFLRRKLDWEDFCDLTGIDYYATRNGFVIRDEEIFYMTESKAKQFNLL